MSPKHYRRTVGLDALWRMRGRDQNGRTWRGICRHDPDPQGLESKAAERKPGRPGAFRASRLPPNRPRSRHFPNDRAVAMSASLSPLSVFHMVDVCKTGSATVTMALFVAEKCAFENSANHWPLVLSLRSLPLGGPRSNEDPASRRDSRAALFLRQDTRFLSLLGTSSRVGPGHRGGESGWRSALRRQGDL